MLNMNIEFCGRSAVEPGQVQQRLAIGSRAVLEFEPGLIALAHRAASEMRAALAMIEKVGDSVGENRNMAPSQQ